MRGMRTFACIPRHKHGFFSRDLLMSNGKYIIPTGSVGGLDHSARLVSNRLQDHLFALCGGLNQGRRGPLKLTAPFASTFSNRIMQPVAQYTGSDTLRIASGPVSPPPASSHGAVFL